MSDKIFHPILKWSQTKTNITIQVDVRDLKDEKITIDEKKVVIDYNENGNHYYEELNLKDEIDAEKSSYSKSGFNTSIELVKKNEGFWKSLTTNDKAIPNLKIDWSHFVDSDEEEEPQDAGMGGLGNMGNMGNMGDMGNMANMANMMNMGGMGGMGGMPDLSKMGNLGNMAGMPDLNQMGNLQAEENDEDDQDDQEGKDANLDDLEGNK